MTSSTLTIHSKYVENMNTFVSSLEDARIYFMFFMADKMDEPVVCDVFSQYNDWYIINGQDNNYWYAYTKSEITFMISNLRVKKYNGPIMLYTVDLSKKSSNDSEIAYLGNHLDFSIHKSKKEVYFKTHWTAYIENEGLQFDRDPSLVCNFIAKEDEIKAGIAKFVDTTVCVYGKDNRPIGMLKTKYDDKLHREIVHDLCQVAIGIPLKHNRSYTGGTPKTHSKIYKGILVTSPEFYKFIANTIFEPLFANVKLTPSHVLQYFDEGNEFHKNGNQSIQYIIEFEVADTAIALSISSHRALKSCWTSLNKANSSEKEKKCLKQWLKTCKSVHNTDYKFNTN